MLFSNTPHVISGKVSIFLDSLRIIAALTVFYVHANNQWNGIEQTLPDLSHLSVVIFFVLSGFVIALQLRTIEVAYSMHTQGLVAFIQ